MNNLMEQFEKAQIKKLTSKKNIPTFRPGDTLKIVIKITEGDRSRLQSFEGVCISRKNNSVNSKFTVRKISHGEGVQRVFPLFSPIIDKIEVIKKGDINRAKLYYLKDRTGKRARISDRDRGEELDEYIATEPNEESQEDKKEDNQDAEKNVPEKDNASPKAVEEPVTEEKKPIEEKSESTASEADKTEDESKS